MVEQIEHVGPELKLLLFADCEILEQREIDSVVARSVNLRDLESSEIRKCRSSREPTCGDKQATRRRRIRESARIIPVRYRANDGWASCGDGAFRIGYSSWLKRISHLDCGRSCSHRRLPIGGPGFVTDVSRCDIERTTVLGYEGKARGPSPDGIVQRL